MLENARKCDQKEDPSIRTNLVDDPQGSSPIAERLLTRQIECSHCVRVGFRGTRRDSDQMKKLINQTKFTRIAFWPILLTTFSLLDRFGYVQCKGTGVISASGGGSQDGEWLLLFGGILSKSFRQHIGYSPIGLLTKPLNFEAVKCMMQRLL